MLIPLEDLVRTWSIPPIPVLHIGAHTAEEAPVYAALGFSPVWWVEADPQTIPALTAAAKRYDGATVVHAACSDKKGEAVFHRANNEQSSSLLELGTHKTAHPEVHFVDSFTVETTTVDQLFRDRAIGQARFVNIDVQGAELLVLRGARSYLHWVDYLYLEVNEAELYEGCALLPDLDAHLKHHNFVRAETRMTGFGWGDAFYTRMPS